MSDKVDRAAYEQTSTVLKALAHPDRLTIVAGVMKNECNVGEIQENLGLPQSTVSQHLRILRDAGVIKGRNEGTKRCYKVINDLARTIVTHMEED
jgi:ArsR family transcriptional regulator